MFRDAISKQLNLMLCVVGVSIATAASLLIFGGARADQESTASAGGSVVLELFTSQGCSSCPPADALLSEIGSSTRDVIPLAYHVDYWNHLGWSDPFSSHEFSKRQSAYARALNVEGDYTPQAVIAGTFQYVGSDSRGISRAIEAARSGPTMGRVNLHTSVSASQPPTVRIRLTAQLSKGSSPGSHEIMVAIFENGLVAKIGGGENGGRTVTYDYTVRRLLPAFEIDSGRDEPVEKQLSLDLDPAWRVEHLGVAAFIQDNDSLRILAAASQCPIPRN